MSRRRVDINPNKYLIVGWDPPISTFFWQLWDGESEREMQRLEDLAYRHSSNSTTEERSKAEKNLEEMYEKYPGTGGEPIISAGGYGFQEFETLEQLEQKMSLFLGSDIKIELERDKDLGR